MKQCFETTCREIPTQYVEYHERILHLCPAHAAAYSEVAAWEQMLEELHRAEEIGDAELAAALDEEQIAWQRRFGSPSA